MNSFICSCPPGTQGQFCEGNDDDCYAEDACNNQGKCIDEVNGFSCECMPGFVGPHCEGKTHFSIPVIIDFACLLFQTKLSCFVS